MTPSEAAKFIGCSTRHVCKLISDKTLKATKQKSDANQHGYVYNVSVTSAKQFKNRKTSGQGWPRGKKRT